MFSNALPIAVVGIAWMIMGFVGIRNREMNIHPGREKVLFTGEQAVVVGLGAIAGGFVMTLPVVAGILTENEIWGDRIIIGLLAGVGITVIGILFSFTRSR